jgi:2,4-dienoyl-CoA reductase-like NADH-dependent reductase (Old Yellow Enzyme family)
MSVSVSSPLTLSNGVVIPNRIVKAAMSEYMCDPDTNTCLAAFRALYEHWADAGAGMLLTGNVMVTRDYMEAPTNLAVTGADDPGLRAVAAAMAKRGVLLVAQISHSGRQTPITVSRQPIAPSAVALKLFPSAFVAPREMTLAEIAEVRTAFLRTALTLAEAGFAGVQLHAAHGYLLSSFLSPLTNLRTDGYGGTAEGRSRLLLEILAELRAQLLPRFPRFVLAVKMNSSDFQRGGLSTEDALQLVAQLEAAGAHLVELSGGSYERTAFMGRDVAPSASTAAREAYFGEFAAAARRAVRGQLRVMLTGGFVTVAGMNAALAGGECDLVGLARPFVAEPVSVMRQVAAGTFAGRLARPGTTLVGPTSPLRALNEGVEAIWYARQMHRLAAGLPVALGLSRWASLAFAVPKYFVHPRWLRRIAWALAALIAFLVMRRTR